MILLLALFAFQVLSMEGNVCLLAREKSEHESFESKELDMQLEDMQISVIVPATKEFPRNMGADIIELKDGTLFLAFSRWFTGRSDFDCSRVCGMLSTDDGRTWGKPFNIIVPDEESESVRMPSITRLNDGQIVMFVRYRTSVTDSWAGMARCLDETKLTSGESAWTKLERISPPPPGRHILLNNRVTRLSTGRLIIPLSSPWPWEREDRRGKDVRSWCLISDDDGASWSQNKTMLAGPKRGLMEPYIVELSDKRLLMLMRTQMDCQYQSFSSDGGTTWSPAEAGNLVSPESPAVVRRDPNTNLLVVVWNHNKVGQHTKDRIPLTVAFSRDEGQTWFGEVNLETEPGKSYSYPGLNFIRGRTYVTYYEASSDGISLKLCSFVIRDSS